MTAVLEPMLQSPKLPLYVAQLNEVLASEQTARRQFRDALTGSEKAEFINGQVVMHSPARFRDINAGKRITILLSTFVARHHLGWVGDEKVLVGLTRNDYEPDIVYYDREKAALFQPEQDVFPAPDLAVEVLSESTEARDRGVKKEDYAAHGVREYWLVDPAEEFVEQYDLQGENYVLRVKQIDGTLRSTVITGFTVPLRAIFDEELNLQVLSQIIKENAPASNGATP